MAAGAAARPAPATRAGAAQPRPAPARRPQRRPALGRRAGCPAPPLRRPRVAAPSRSPSRLRGAVRPRAPGAHERRLGALLAGRGWIVLIGALLVGIVFFNVDLLRMNREIALTAEKSTALKRENARLRQQAALLGSSERIQDAAAELGMVLPGAGDVRYLKAHPEFDARKAARSIIEPTRSGRATGPGRGRGAAGDHADGAHDDHDGSRRHHDDRSRCAAAQHHDHSADHDDHGAGAPRPHPPPRPRAARWHPRPRPPLRLGVRLVERRIGLLFAVFLALLAIAAVRAVWIGTVKAGSLKERAVDPAGGGPDGQRQARHDLRPQRARAGGVRGRDHRLREPVPDQEPRQGGRASWRRSSTFPRTSCSASSRTASRGFVYLRRKMDSWNGHKVAQLKIEGIGTVTEPKRTYPQGWLAAQVLGNVGLDNDGLAGPRVLARRASCAATTAAGGS